MTVLKDLFLHDRKFRIGFIIIILILIIAFLSFISPYEPDERSMPRKNLEPSWEHWLGTNATGQDIFWILTFAVRNSLFVALVSALISRCIAMVNGLFSGYIGGKTDRVLSTLTDSFIVVPRLPLLILLSFIFKDNITLLFMGLLLGFLDWAWPSKRYRSQILSLKEREFTFTAIFSGMKTPKVIYKEHFPFLIPYMMADIISGFLWAIGMEITLSALGLTNLNISTIGTMIYWANYYQSMLQGRWNWLGPPIIASILTVLSLYLLSDSIGAFLDPRTKLKRIMGGGIIRCQ